MSSCLERLGYVGGKGREVLVKPMYCSSVGLEGKSGVQSDLPLSGCLGGSGLVLKIWDCLILKDLEILSKSDNKFSGILGYEG